MIELSFKNCHPGTFVSTQTDPSHSALFTPVAFGNRQLRNRIAMAPMTRSKSPGGVPNQDNLEYYQMRAAGGLGLIITEGTLINHPSASGYPDVPNCHGSSAMNGWKEIVEAVHAKGCAIIPQIWHVGSVRQTGEPLSDASAIGPSAVVHPSLEKGAKPPEVMSHDDIAEVIAAFAQSAREAQLAGFDGVEIHGAHGYLIDQFFWSTTNLREDEYGGSLVQRTRFACQVIAAVRKSVGPNFPICLRFSQFKLGDYDHQMATTPDELEKWLAPLSDAGVDIFHCSTRRFNKPEFEGSPLNLAGWTKRLTGKPAISVGSIGLDADFLSSFTGKGAKVAAVENLVERLQAEEFDIVAVGRAVLADPEWANKVRAGRFSEIEAFAPEHLQRYP